MKAKKKRGVEAPLRVRTFINTVINTPLENIEVPLARFSWDYEKGDFYHWVDLLNHFESFFEKYVKPRKDLQLDGNFLEEDRLFPKEAVLQILRVTRIVLENCMNKYLYNSNEHVSALFASTDPEVVIAALETLASFVKKPVQSTRAMRWHGDAALNARLFSLSQGWGGKEEGLGLLACAIENGCDVDACRLGSTLHFEFYADGNVQGEEELKSVSKASGLQVIHIPDLHSRSENDLQLLKQLIDQYTVPPSLRFSLLTRIRFARAFASLTSRRQYICIRLLAFTVLLQSNPDHEDLTAFFINEPEFVNELVTVLRCEDSVPEDIRILAVLALAAQSQDRPRQSNVLTVISAGGHRGILPSLMQKAVGSVTGGTCGCSVSFVEALLSLVTVLVSSSSGCAALREAGLIPTLLPLLKDMNRQHTHLVSSAVHILEAFMDYSNPAGTLFRDLGGLDDTIARLKLEVSRVEEGATKQKEELQLDSKGKAPMIEDGDSPQAVVQAETSIPYHQRLLLKALLRAIALGTYAPGSTARLHGSEESALPACLCTIFRHAKEFGGGVFSLAASVMSDLIHKDPTCFASLDAAGLPAAFLDAITSGVLPSSEAVSCIPNSLDALCLNNLGLQAVKDRNALGCFVRIFTSKMYLRALANDTPGSLASGVDELMRHAPTLRGPGIDMCIEILKTIATIGGAVEVPTSAPSTEAPSSDSPVPMDTDPEERPVAPSTTDDASPTPAQAGTSHQVVEPAGDGSNGNVEAFLPECINNVVRLLETILQNADTSRVFIEKKGIEALLQLYTLPHLPVSFGGSSTAHNMSVTFRAFSPQHAAALTRAVCGALKDHLKITVELLNSIAGTKLSDLETGMRNKVVRCLSAAECFISLSSVLVRSSMAMMPELSSGSSEVLSDVGKVHREVLWQIALIDDAKLDLKKEVETGGSTPGSTTVSTGTREGDDDTDVYSVIRYVNPVPSRNGPASHWGVESDFLPVFHSGSDGPHRRRREHAVTTEAITQMARLGRLSRHNTDPVQVDLESSSSLSEMPQSQENTKRKSPDAANFEMMTRLVGAARGLYVALGKAMVIPSRRRDETVNISGPAKSAASALAKLLWDELSFDGHGTSSQSEPSVSVKCRYLGKVVEDIIAVVFDSRRRTCNTVLVNNLFAHGAIKQLLVTFEATSQLLWRVPQASGSPMETENGKVEGEKLEDKSDGNSWLLDTLRNYARLLEHLVTSSLLLTPTSMAQLLVQPVAGGSIPVPKDSESFIRSLQAQVLEVILPVWNHPMFPQCSSSFITSIAAIITHVYTGVGDVKGHRSGGGGAAGVRLVGPPPDESSIMRIVEMGFSRSRAEEALRRVEINSVEMATEWLCSLPEGAAQEDDELARALALSLGSADGSPKEDTPGKGKEVVAEEEGGPQAPPVEDMLSTCMNLLQNTDAVAFPLTDLLVTMCNRNKGQDRPRVISYLIQQLKQCKVEESQSDGSALSTVSHTLALVLSEDSTAREIAAEIGLVKIALETLISFTPSIDAGCGRVEVPKWATALLLVLYHMLQYKPKVNSDVPSPAAGAAPGNNSAATGSVAVPDAHKPEVEDDKKEKDGNPFVGILGKPTGYMTDDEQRRAMSVCCTFLQMHLPAMAIQAVLQLCARLTKTHVVAMQFLEAGGLTALLGLPRNCLFPGFDSVAAAIIRHLLEDPQTLQQAMESEIRHTLIATLSRHNGRVSPRMFLTAMAPVVSRDPSIFMQAVAVVCQIETVAGRPTIVLAKEKEKEKDKEKEKEKDKDKEKDKVLEKEKGKSPSVEAGINPTDVGLKIHDGSAKFVKGHKKVPHSFSQVMDQLLEVILHYPPPGKDDDVSSKDGFTTAMEVDELAPKDKGKGKVDDLVKPECDNLSESSAALAKVAFILKLTTEVLLMYSSAVSVVLRRDSESSQGRGPSQGGTEVIGHGGLLYHVLHRLLPYPGDKTSEKLNDDEWREKLSDRAGCFLMAVCVRSGEGRRRVVVEIGRALTVAANNAVLGTGKGLQPPNRKVRVFVDLVNYFLSHHSSSGTTQAPGFSTDMAKTMMDAGMVQALTLTLQVIDLDHPDAPKLVNAVLKGMEILTRAGSGEQAYGSDGSNLKKGASGDRPDQRATGGNGHPASDTRQEGDPPAQTRDETMRDSLQAEAQSLDGSLHPSTGADTSREDLMEHDMRLDREAAEEAQLDAEAEEEFMREAAEDAAELEDAAAEMAYRMEHGPDDDVGDEDDDEEDMDGDDGDDDGDEDEEEEEEDEEEDEDDIEGDEGVPHLSPPDTDVEDHEDNGLGDEYEDDMVEEEDEDDDWREDRIIEVRWRDGLTGLNHVQLLGHTGTANLADFSGDPFQGMNMDDVFGNFRRPGGGDRRRGTAYRAFPERPGGDRGGAFHHPLLTRPSPTPGVGSTGPVMAGSLWPTTGSFVRDAETMLGGGSGLDVTHFYMYDAPMLPDHAGDGLFGERGGVAPPPPLLDFSMDPVYLMGRRGGRADSRLSSWTDDGQPQAGAHAAAVAQAIEEQFISQLRLLVPGEEQLPGQVGTVNAPETIEAADARQPEATEDMEGAEPDGSQLVTETSISEQRSAQRAGEGEPADGGLGNASINLLSPGLIEGGMHSSEQATRAGADLDVQMQDERNEPVVRDTEAGSQDSGGSGATVGESLRSLEVEIGSADGLDPDERQAGADRLSTGEGQRTVGVEAVPGGVGSISRTERGDADEDMDVAGRVGQQGDEVDISERSTLASAQEESGVPASASRGAGNRGGEGEGEGVRRAGGNPGVNAIDPTFLEALPEDLRAEVLASQQTQTIRTTSQPPPPAEDIDPEFLAALPPDIQAEVLAQQRAQRIVQAQQVEGQPVDMDSASIIATFPAELREEVLLTSSEAVLAALPPALLAEAQLLRERAMTQYQARGLFGGHRIGSRRNNMSVGTGGAGAAMDRGVGGGASLSMGRRSGVPLSSGAKVKEAEGKPLVDTAALKAMLRLLRLAQPLGKGLLQKLLLNLCAHSVTRVTLLQLLLDMLRPEAEGIPVGSSSADGAPSQRLYGCQWNVVYARSQLSDGVPPLVSRRVLEILTYLARNHSPVANLLLYLEPLTISSSADSETFPLKEHDAKKEKGKAKVVDGPVVAEELEVKPKGEIPLILLLKLLNQPLYSRSSAHLEQVMGLLEVVTSNAGVKADLRARTKSMDAANSAASAPPSGTITSPENAGEAVAPAAEAVAPAAEAVAPAAATSGAEEGDAQPNIPASTLRVDTSRPDAQGDGGVESIEPSTSGLDHRMDPTTVLLSLPEPELRNLCKLLAREGLSDTAYTRVAEVLKKLANAAPPHRRLFVTELADAARRLGGPAVVELASLGDADTVVVSTTSMAGAAILRVLQALSALTALATTEKENVQDTIDKEQEDGMVVVRELNSALEGLWHGLSVSVGKIEGRLGNSSVLATPSSSAAAAAAVVGAVGVPPPLPPGTQKLLPFVEAFFVLCEKLRFGPTIAGQAEPSSATAREIKEAASSSALDVGIVTTPRSPPTPQRKPDEKGMTFIRFADRHRRLLNAFVRQNPGLLEKSLSLMLKTPRLIDFDNKRAYFRSRIRQQHEQQHYAPLRICVRRAYVLEDSYNQLRMRTPEELKGRLTVQFQGEEGIDAGGLTREWYQLLSRVTFDKGALLFTTVGNESTFQPNPNSVYQTEHLSYFKFVGRVVAKALFDGQLLDVYFTRSFYKHILGVKVTYHDIEAIDPDYYKNLKWMLENDISDILGLTFSMDADEEKHILYEKTEVTDHELIAGGRNIRVTEENKHEYVDLVAEHRLTTAIRPQITAFLDGFYELVSRELISIFNDKELELLISGLPEIDLEDLKANTEYTGYTAASPVVQWFWEVVRAFNKEDMARLLQFITGTSKVPLEGFRALQGISGPQRFQIHKAYGAPERLPSAHTCFNQLDLPEYSSKDQLQERLLLAIHEASEGFGFG